MSKFKFTGAEMDLVMDVIGNYIHNGLQTSQLFDRIESLLSERDESETAQLRAENERLRAEVKRLTTYDIMARDRHIDALQSELSAANQRIAELEDLLKSDSVYGLLRFAYKSPESAHVDDVGDNKYYDLYEISKKLRENKTK